MAGSLFPSPGREQSQSEQKCSDCGQLFRPHQVGDGIEELCQYCYEAQFEPKRLHYWQQPKNFHSSRRGAH